MNPLESLIEWFRTKFMDKKRFVTCAKNVVPTGAWPSENEKDVVFFTAIIETLKDVSREHAVSVLASWAREFHGQSDYLEKLTYQFDQQSGAGIDLDAALAASPPPLPHASTSPGASGSALPLSDEGGDRGRQRIPTSGEAEVAQKSSEFDVFLCYNSQDKPAVKHIAERLRDNGIRPWLDEWELRPGVPWQPALERQIGQIKAAAVFVGEPGIGPWQREELDAYLREFIRRGCPVIPVLLPEAPQKPDLPIFLAGRTWVDFRTSEPDPLMRLVWAIRGDTPRAADPDELYDHEVPRESLFRRFVEFSRERDIVFAFGGAKSGLKTFSIQLEKYLNNQKGLRRFTKADLQVSEYESIKTIRLEETNHIHGKYVRYEAQFHLNVKCLFASLAYSACQELHYHFGAEIEGVVDPKYLANIEEFTGFYFGKGGGVMGGTDEAAIVEYFFSRMQEFAEATSVDEIVVFMPWERLSSWFRDPVDSTPGEIWAALQRYTVGLADRPTDASVFGRRAKKPTRSKYDKICIIVFADRIPTGHEASTKTFLSRTIWPIPPLSIDEIQEMLLFVSSDLGASIGPAEAVLEATGGLPWFVCLLLTYVNQLQEERGRMPDQELLVSDAVERTEEALRSPSDLPLILREHIGEYKATVRARLAGSNNAVDLQVRHAWAGAARKRERGVKVDSARIDDWLSTGLVWLDGDPWDPDASDHVFGQFARVFFRPAARLPFALYDSMRISGELEE